MYGIGWVFSRSIWLIVDEIVFGYHFDIGVFDIDGNWSTKGNGDGSISGEECPPDAFPESFVGFAELRAFDAVVC